MGTPSATKYIKLVAGTLKEFFALSTSAGSADEDAIPALNSDGVLDHSIVNATTTSVGAGDADKLVALDSSGKIDASMLPASGGGDTAIIEASESLAANNYVNIHEVGGAFRVRKADASAANAGKQCHGFVLAAVSSGANATVYFEGPNAGVSGMTPGNVYLSETPGEGTNTPPTTSGSIVQRIGMATSATVVNFEVAQPVELA